MLSDMAEGSADYPDHENPYDEYGDEDDMSGSGDDSCKQLLINDLARQKLIFFLCLDGREVPIVEPGRPDDLPHDGNAGTKTTGAASTLRISQVSATLVLSSLIVILFKQF